MTDKEAFFALFKSKFLQGAMSDSLKEDMAFAYTEGWKAHAEHIAKQEPFAYVLASSDEWVFRKALNENDALVYCVIPVYTPPQPSVPDLDDLVLQSDIKFRGVYLIKYPDNEGGAEELIHEAIAPANHTDNSAVIAALQEKLKVTTDALIKLRDCDWVISIPDRMNAVRNLARDALSELSQEKGE